MRIEKSISVLVLFSLLTACHLQMGQAVPTQPSNVDVVGTAVALTSAAKFTEIAGSAVPVNVISTAMPTFTPTLMPTQCTPLVTSTVNANVRSGPGTAYDIVGSLLLGQTATIVGRNDAYSWWYIAYPGAAGGHAWIAGSVVTSACVPSVVQVVAAPPLPTAAPTEDTSSDDDDSDDGGGGGEVAALPDLVPNGMQVRPHSGGSGNRVDVQVRVRNSGEAAAGSFTVEWRATASSVGCSWTVTSLAPGESKALSCSYTYLKTCISCSVVLVIDPFDQIAEENEHNNNHQDSYPP